MYRSFKGSKKIAVIVIVGLLISGCAGMKGRLEPPRISLADLRVRDMQGFESVFEVDLRIYNRNQQPLNIEGVDIELVLNGTHLAQGVAGVSREIAPYSSDIVPLTVYASMLDFAALVHRLLKDGGKVKPPEQLHYALQGHVRVAGQGFFDKIPFDTEGHLDLRQLTGANP